MPAKDRPQNEKALRVIAICIAVGSLWSVFYAAQTSSFAQFVAVTGVALMIAGAALLTGGLLGFLFGIPRTLQQDAVEEAAQDPEKKSAPDNATRAISYKMNTNLEQISDWLTKILVGVGLTQITAIPGVLQRYADYAAPGLGNFPNSKAFALATLVYFLVCGFLMSYLWTRLYLAGVLRQADLAAIGGKLAEVESKVSELERQAEIDAKALNIVQRQLNPVPDTAPIPQEEINAALKLASSNAKAQVFYQVRGIRSENWRERQGKPKMERTIPVFRALVASDTDDVYHANHGQLGFALKDQRQPNWTEADFELTRAIEIRGPWQEHGWLLYELNRAICRINLDEAFKQERESDDKTKQIINADLKAAANAQELVEIIANEPAINRWLKLNGITWPKTSSRIK